MDFEEMNQRAYDRKPEPDGLTPAERMIWLALRLLYELHFHGGLTREEGVAYKQELKKDYERNLAQEAEWLRAGTAMKKKRVNPHRRPATLADVQKAKKAAQNEAVTTAWAIFFSALRDKEGFGYTRLRRVWDEVNYLADSVSKGYVSIADLEKELEDYGITLR